MATERAYDLGCDESELDPLVVPMVRYFNENGLETLMSCQGHNDTNMSMFWIEFSSSVTQEDILNFMKKHLNRYANFVSCGRFAKRIYGFYGINDQTWGCREGWYYFAATAEAANADLKRWTHDPDGFDGFDGERYLAWRNEMKQLGKI